MNPSTRMDARIAKRRAQVRRERMHERRRRVLVVVLALCVIAVGAWIEQSPLVALAEVQVTGTQALDPDTVRNAAGLHLGTSTLRLRLRAAARRVEALPLARRATVRRVDPLTVRIHVEERQPAFVLRTARRSALVDTEGVVVAHAAGGRLPVMATSLQDAPPVGASIVTVRGAADAYRIYAALPRRLRPHVVRYEAQRRDDADLLLASGARLRFGRPVQIADKMRVLGALLEDLGDRRISVIDVRVPANPVVVPAASGDGPGHGPG